MISTTVQIKPDFRQQEECTNRWVSSRFSSNSHWPEKSVYSPGNHDEQTEVMDGQLLIHSASSVELIKIINRS